MVDRSALEAAQRIIDKAEKMPARPTIAELEEILARPENDVPITINPDGSIGRRSNDELIVARALLSAAKERRGPA
jgi:hypothetical protein